MEDFLSQFGQVEDVHMPTNEVTGKNRGFAFVRYNEKEEAQRAIRASGIFFNDRALTIDKSEQKRGDRDGGDRGDRGGRGGRGGFNDRYDDDSGFGGGRY